MAATHAAAFTQSRHWTEGEFAGLLRRPGCFISGNAECFALASCILDEAELLTIATQPRSRRQGLARTCMEEWQAIAHTRGATRAFLEVAADNHGAIALYRCMGYDTCGSRPGYYPRQGTRPADALVMARSLP